MIKKTYIFHAYKMFSISRLYPVDKSRVNEFGMSFEDEKSEGKPLHKKKKD